MSTVIRTELDLNAIEARANAATPGPWGVGNGTNIVRGLEVTGRASYTCIQSVAEVGDNDDRLDWFRDEAVEVDPEDDARFIAAARTDVPALVAEVRRFKPITVPDGSQLFMHTCHHTEWWTEAEQGPVNDQGCDACESAPFTGGWQPVYVRDAAPA